MLFLDLIPKLNPILRRASPDFQFENKHKLSCYTLIAYSSDLNQIIALKFPTREDYISPATAKKYLQGTRKTIEQLFKNDLLKNKLYILNILISDSLTKSCISLKGLDHKQRNMDMLFNPKITKNKEIISIICNALYNKTKNWKKKIQDGCKKQGLKPYKKIEQKIKLLNNAENVFFKEKYYINKEKS